jgi:hypothetical protein
METLTLYIILSTLLCANAAARIGETEPQIEKRYGKAVKKIGVSEFDMPGFTRIYRSSGIEVIVTFIDGVSSCEHYQKIPSAKLDSVEVEAILAANSVAKQWDQIQADHPLYIWRNSRWTLGDFLHQSDALFADFDHSTGELMICSKKFLDASHAASNAAARAKLSGF